MAIYTVLAPKTRDGGALSDPMDVVFVKEGFCWPALFFAGPWLIYRRMWQVLIGYIAIAIGFGLITRQFEAFPGDVLILLHFLFALEGNELRRWTLQRQGHSLVAVAEGRNLEEAEIHHFAAQEGPEAAIPAQEPPPPPRKLGPLQPSAEAGDVVGLFPAPGVAS